MSKAPTTQLGNYVRIRTGKLDANANDPNGDYPFFTCAIEPLNIASYSYDCECVLIAGNGDLNVKYYDGKFDAYQRTYIVESLNKNTLDVRYLYHFLSTYVHKLREMSIGGVIKYIKLNYLTDALIPLPPLPEQKRIAAILDKADAIRRKRQQAVKLTEELLRSVFLDMFGDPVTNPKGWPQAPIKEFGTVLTGNTPSREKPEYYGEKIEWIKSDNINTPYHYLTEARERLSDVGEKVGRIVPAGSILVTCIAGSPDCIGNVALSNRTVAFNQQINAISPFETVDSFYLYSQILVAKKLIQGESTESMKGMVSKGKFENILLIKPPIELQKQFGCVFMKLEALSNKNDKAFSNSDSLFTFLLQQAFRGEL
jgi:type I restriction enzyme S subunit